MDLDINLSHKMHFTNKKYFNFRCAHPSSRPVDVSLSLAFRKSSETEAKKASSQDQEIHENSFLIKSRNSNLKLHENTFFKTHEDPFSTDYYSFSIEILFLIKTRVKLRFTRDSTWHTRGYYKCTMRKIEDHLLVEKSVFIEVIDDENYTIAKQFVSIANYNSELINGIFGTSSSVIEINKLLKFLSLTDFMQDPDLKLGQVASVGISVCHLELFFSEVANSDSMSNEEDMIEPAWSNLSCQIVVCQVLILHDTVVTIGTYTTCHCKHNCAAMYICKYFLQVNMLLLGVQLGRGTNLRPKSFKQVIISTEYVPGLVMQRIIFEYKNLPFIFSNTRFHILFLNPCDCI